MTAFLLGALGGAIGEFLKVSELRGKLHQKKYRMLAKSPLFWLITLGLIGVSGAATWAIYESVQEPSRIHALLTGLGARSLLRSAAEAQAANGGRMLGGRRLDRSAREDEKAEISLGDLLA